VSLSRRHTLQHSVLCGIEGVEHDQTCPSSSVSVGAIGASRAIGYCKSLKGPSKDIPAAKNGPSGLTVIEVS